MRNGQHVRISGTHQRFKRINAYETKNNLENQGRGVGGADHKRLCQALHVREGREIEGPKPEEEAETESDDEEQAEERPRRRR